MMIQNNKRLQKKITMLKRQLNKFPEGTLQCRKNGKYHKWYIKAGEQSRYVPKNEHQTLSKVATKMYLMLQLEELSEEKEAIDKYLNNYSRKEKSKKFLIENPEIKNLIPKKYYEMPENDIAWMNEEYDKNPKEFTGPKHKSITGNILRSKSEAIIEEVLIKYNIPYRYECKLVVAGETFYPDFTIIHPRTRKKIYWENFGMMDKSKYRRDTASKIQMYINDGYIPFVDIIMTFETAAKPLTTEEVEMFVQIYLLN